MNKCDRRGRRGSGRCVASADSMRSERKGREEVKGASQGITVLKEILPGHGSGADQATPLPSKVPILEQLLGSIATPARSVPAPPASTQWNRMPIGPPTHAPMLLVAPSVPPPPPSRPAPACHTPQETLEAPKPTAQTFPESTFASYRERLQAGGRGVFQRTIDSGLMPKAMKPEWGASAVPMSVPAQGFLPHQSEVQSGTSMQYAQAF